MPKMEQLSKNNIGTILDLAIEADIGELELGRSEIINMVESLKSCIDIASKVADSFIAVKITALAPSTLLLNWSTILRKLNATFNSLSQDQNGLSLKQFLQLENEFPGLRDLDLRVIFQKHSFNESINYASLAEIFSLDNRANSRALINDKSSYDANFINFDMADYVIEKINDLVLYAKSKKVKLMMDAEQTYFQPAVDDLVLGLCRRFNPRISSSENAVPVVYNTYQMYLKNSLSRLKQDVHHSEASGYTFGVKLVRGAYMVAERARAVKLGYASPIHNTLEDTHSSYNAGVEFVIERQTHLLQNKSPSASLSMTVASHNHGSTLRACLLMDQNRIPKSGGWVSFAQLLGMQDGLTEKIASQGFRALKYVPYGPVPSVIAYLHRRAQENSQMVAAMTSDKKEILKELRVRLLGLSP